MHQLVFVSVLVFLREICNVNVPFSLIHASPTVPSLCLHL